MDITKIIVLGALVLSCSVANATTFLVTWSGASQGNSATAIGYITIDDAALPAAGQTLTDGLTFASTSAVTDLSITVSGASSGNGTFGLSDFSQFVFYAPSTLDYSQELIGQLLTTGYAFGSTPETGEGGDFNLLAASSNAPSENWYFTLITDSGYGDAIQVVSIVAVPEPSNYAMLLAGLGLIGSVSLRRKRSVAAS
jgi:hypothetical protein